MWRREDQVRKDVSEARLSSSIKVGRISELRDRNTPILIQLKVDAKCSYVTSILLTRVTLHNIPEVNILNFVVVKMIGSDGIFQTCIIL